MNISSTGKKILIISDVHNNVDKLDKIIKSEGADVNVNLRVRRKSEWGLGF